LSDGSYLITWRVVSVDGHPISGASSFVVGTAATASLATAATAARTQSTEPTAPWPVITIRLAGYLAFAVITGIAAFVLLCAPGSSKNWTLQLLVRGGLLGGAGATVAAILIQGPYTAGVSISRVLDTRLLHETLATPFGHALSWRLGLYAVVGLLVWRLSGIVGKLAGWLLPVGLTSIAVTIAAAGHGATSGPFQLDVDALHALTAALWIGGLVAVVALGRSVGPYALQRFSTLAMVSVLTLIITGTVNSLRHLNAVEELWRTRYGLTLMIKLAVVAAALTAAAVSRRRLQQHRVPLQSVRIEAALTIGILIVTALLSTTAPPPHAAEPNTHSDHAAQLANGTVMMSLGDRGKAVLTVVPASTAGSRLQLALTDTTGQTLSATRVSLKMSNPGRDIAAIPVPMKMLDGGWVASYRFAFPGRWKAILTVDGISESAVVTTADIRVATGP
jgi:copper transport protein